MKHSRSRKSPATAIAIDLTATQVPVSLDTPGLFFIEARSRVEAGAKAMGALLAELESHTLRVAAAGTSKAGEAADEAWTAVIRELGRVETDFGALIRNFLVADVLLVAAAEAYVNSVAAHVLTRADAENFDKLSPVGKWLFLPRIMKLKWAPSVAEGCLQQFASVVSRRNRVIHAKDFRVRSAVEAHEFIKQLRLETSLARAGVLAVRDLVREFSLSWRGSYGPDWLDVRKARTRPPCFILGPPDGPARFARARRKPAK